MYKMYRSAACTDGMYCAVLDCTRRNPRRRNQHTRGEQTAQGGGWRGLAPPPCTTCNQEPEKTTCFSTRCPRRAASEHQLKDQSQCTTVASLGAVKRCTSASRNGVAKLCTPAPEPSRPVGGARARCTGSWPWKHQQHASSIVCRIRPPTAAACSRVQVRV